jgi:hypothetical protein
MTESSRSRLDEELTLFMCGPSKCEHDYSLYVPIIMDGRECGETLACAKCGATAFEEDQWP